MNYLTEERKNALAAEYVLGTLHGRARIRFQRLLMQHRSLRHVLWQWESRLNSLGGGLLEIKPPAHLWRNIQKQLGFTDALLPDNVIPLPQRKTHTWHWLTGFATAAAIVLAVLLFVPQSNVEPAQNQIAVVQGEKAQALWLIELGKKELTVSVTDGFQSLPDHDYELWMIAADGRPPVSLGLLPKRGKVTLPRLTLLDQVKVAALAVSLEPIGGSPNGQPTKVLYTTEIVTL